MFEDGPKENDVLSITDHVSISIEKDIIKKYVRRIYKLKKNNGELEEH
jgi:hypothetical protein